MYNSLLTVISNFTFSSVHRFINFQYFVLHLYVLIIPSSLKIQIIQMYSSRPMHFVRFMCKMKNCCLECFAVVQVNFIGETFTRVALFYYYNLKGILIFR